MIGQRLGHYRIVEKIGAGGMGEVYRAHDERLERDVALKVLPAGTLADEQARKRFRKEALALSKLNHPHIATVFDFDTQDGTDFLVMELVEGVTLSDKLAVGPLPEKEISRLGGQVAEALEEAHEQGVVHRDLKPGNIKVTPKGQVKILDFGIAKLLRPVSATATTESFTETQGVVGTLPYMAPEQLRGQAVDARTDIWALGVLLYEAARGERPFQGQTGYELSSAILREAPAPLPVPGALRAVIERCLEKEPGERYQRASEVRAVLEALQSEIAPVPAASRRRRSSGRVRRVGRRRIRVLAVLPLENLSGDPEQDYFTDGMTEALIADLAKIGALRVISRTSVMQYKGARKPLPEIARELNVDAVVEGSVLRVGERARITAQLIEATTDQHLWAESYERDLHDVLTLQREVARAIAQEIKITLTPREKAHLASARAVHPEALELYLKGRYHWNRRTQEGFDRSIEYFQQALELDANYALAYAGLADTYASLAIWGRLPIKAVLPKAKAAALKALELDNTLGEAHAVLAYLASTYEWDWSTAEREYKRAIDLSPSDATVHYMYAWNFLHPMGRHKESVAEARRARELDPLSIPINVGLGRLYHRAGQYENAIEEYRKALELDPDAVYAQWALGVAYVQTGMYEEAIATFLKRKVPTAGSNWALGYAYGVSGKRGEARKVLNSLLQRRNQGHVPPTMIAIVHVGLGEKDKAFEWLEKAYEERDDWLTSLKVEPWLDPLRSDLRFHSLLHRMNFPE